MDREPQRHKGTKDSSVPLRLCGSVGLRRERFRRVTVETLSRTALSGSADSPEARTVWGENTNRNSFKLKLVVFETRRRGYWLASCRC